MKVKVSIEETLCRTVEIDVPDDCHDSLEYAEEIAEEMYRNEEIVLDAEDFTGVQMSSEDENGNATDWHNF